MMRTSLSPSPETLAITDTNVLLDIYSCHDLTTTYNEAHMRPSRRPPFRGMWLPRPRL
jgi:hypothetical protein